MHFKSFPCYLYDVFIPELYGQKMTWAIGIRAGAELWGRYSLTMVVSARAKSRTKAVALLLLQWPRTVRWRKKKWLSGVCPVHLVSALYSVKSSCLKCEIATSINSILGRGQKHLLGIEFFLLWKRDDYTCHFSR